MSLKLSKESLIVVLETRSPRSLTEIYRVLGGAGKLSGSTAKRMRELVPGIDEWVDNNKAKAGEETGKAHPQEGKAKFRTSKTSKSAKKTAKAGAKSKVPRAVQNPFRPGSGYGLLLDIIANAGAKGIGKPDLLKAYCKATGKDDQHARYDLAVINSAREDSDKRHRSCADGFAILKEGDCFRVRFP